MDRVYVFMRRDELGDEVRAHGTEFLEGEYRFPDFEEGDEAMNAALWAWQQSLELRGQEEWEELFGSESHIFLEEKDSSVFNRRGSRWW